MKEKKFSKGELYEELWKNIHDIVSIVERHTDAKGIVVFDPYGCSLRDYTDSDEKKADEQIKKMCKAIYRKFKLNNENDRLFFPSNAEFMSMALYIYFCN